jgi:carboxymethylenebutenolidase
MAGLATLAAQPPGMQNPTPATGFRAALLFYPSCRIQLRQEYRPYTPTVMFIGSEDAEVAPVPCRQLAEQVRLRGVSHFDMIWYEGATHSFDDPGKRRQSDAANRDARADSMRRAEQFFERHLIVNAGFPSTAEPDFAACRGHRQSRGRENQRRARWS